MRLFIKSRAAALNLKMKDLIDELANRGIKVNGGDFSNYISGKKKRRKKQTRFVTWQTKYYWRKKRLIRTS